MAASFSNCVVSSVNGCQDITQAWFRLATWCRGAVVYRKSCELSRLSRDQDRCITTRKLVLLQLGELPLT